MGEAKREKRGKERKGEDRQEAKRERRGEEKTGKRKNREERRGREKREGGQIGIRKGGNNWIRMERR